MAGHDVASPGITAGALPDTGTNTAPTALFLSGLVLAGPVRVTAGLPAPGCTRLHWARADPCGEGVLSLSRYPGAL